MWANVCAGSAKVKRMPISIALMCVMSVYLCFGQDSANGGRAKQSPPRPYRGALVSWQDSNGRWNFTMFEWLLGRLPTLEDVRQFPVMRGLTQLKSRIASLPKGSSVFWEDQRILDPNSVNPGEGLRLTIPPPAVVGDVKGFAKVHHVEIIVTDRKDTVTGGK